MVYRYYSTQRPVGPGAIPKGARYIYHFDGRVYVKSINRMAYGIAEYDRELTDDEVRQYELVKEVGR